MPDPTHAVVAGGTVTDVVLMDTATAQLFRDYGFVEMLWGSGGQLVDVTALDPQPAIGWAYDGEDFAPPPAPEPPAAEPADPPALEDPAAEQPAADLAEEPAA